MADAHELPFASEFDQVFTNATLHWMHTPRRVLEGVHRALVGGGTFVGEFGGFGNVAAIASAMHAVGAAMGGDTALAHPWFFPTRGRFGAMLEEASFTVQRLETFPRQTPLPTDLHGWLGTFRAPFFSQFGSREAEAYARVADALRPSLCDEEGRWFADYVRLRFRAVRRD